MALNQDNICIDTNNQAATVTLATDDDSRATVYDLDLYTNPSFSTKVDNIPNTLHAAGVSISNDEPPVLSVAVGNRGTLFIRYISRERTSVEVLNQVDFILSLDTRGPSLEQPDVTISTNGATGSWQLEKGRHLSGGKYQIKLVRELTWIDSGGFSGPRTWNNTNRTIATAGGDFGQQTLEYRYIVGSSVIASTTFKLRIDARARTAPYLVQGDVRVEANNEAATVTLPTRVGSRGTQNLYGLTFHRTYPSGTFDRGVGDELDASTGIRFVASSRNLIVPAGIRGSVYVVYQHHSTPLISGIYEQFFALIYDTTSCGKTPAGMAIYIGGEKYTRVFLNGDEYTKVYNGSTQIA